MTPSHPFLTIRDATPAHEIPKGAVIALGNFDGVHLGHRAAIGVAFTWAAAGRTARRGRCQNPAAFVLAC